MIGFEPAETARLRENDRQQLIHELRTLPSEQGWTRRITRYWYIEAIDEDLPSRSSTVSPPKWADTGHSHQNVLGDIAMSFTFGEQGDYLKTDKEAWRRMQHDAAGLARWLTTDPRHRDNDKVFSLGNGPE